MVFCLSLASNFIRSVKNKILAGVRNANVDVQVSPDGKQYTITVISPHFENLPPFKRRELVQNSLGSVRTEVPLFASCQVTQLNLHSPAEILERQHKQSLEQ
jgi:acid stress-induced BolA-like protein IbaG/YrbA